MMTTHRGLEGPTEAKTLKTNKSTTTKEVLKGFKKCSRFVTFSKSSNPSIV
jgi:hypothetical protein